MAVFSLLELSLSYAETECVVIALLSLFNLENRPWLCRISCWQKKHFYTILYNISAVQKCIPSRHISTHFSMNKFALNSFYCKFIEKSKDAYHIDIISNLFVEEYLIFSVYCTRYNNTPHF